MLARLLSLRLWLPVAMIASAGVGLAAAAVLYAHVEHSHEYSADQAKALAEARTVARQVQAGADRDDLTALQELLTLGPCRGEHEHPGRPSTVARGSRCLLWATGTRRPRPSLDSEPRRILGLEVAKASNISLTPPSSRLDLPPVPPRQRPRDPNSDIRPPTVIVARTPYQ